MSIAAAITVEPCGGLGNRMRALDSGIALSRAMGRELHVVWTVRKEMPCRLEELFEVPAVIAALRQPRDPRIFRWLRLRRMHRSYAHVFDAPDIDRLVTGGTAVAELTSGLSVMIRTSARFFGNPQPFADLVPAAPILREITRYQPGLGRMIGVHIRRQDNRQSVAASPTAAFVRQMRRELELDRDVQFFLATDEPREEATLRQEFGDRIHSHAKTEARRRRPQAARDAVVDLYCLAGCRKLLGSHYSSFSDAAAAIHGIPLQIVRQAD
jgi:hypothetical protein